MEPLIIRNAGFLGTRASFMIDLVAVAMIGVVILLGLSIALVRYRKCYALHKRIQLALATALLLLVALFEAEMRIIGWRWRAESSPFYDTLVMPVLAIHIAFAASTLALWTKVIVSALLRFEHGPLPGPHSASHRFWGYLAAVDMLCTAVSGWGFYWLAFVAS
jgi:putative membrane protein